MISEPIDDEQFPCVCIVTDDAVTVLQPIQNETAEGTRSRKESESRQALPDDTAERNQVLVTGPGGADQEQETGSADEAAKTLTHLDPPPTIRTSGEAAAARPWHSCRSYASHRCCCRRRS